ncbi:putative lipoprotein, borrelia PFam60 protein (plasmid) [Borreliella bissettiae DN127]|uniref:Lipoprotein, borrelia PFam60 protein n=1 Tax=Borrelia bissettiae (strain DSM 17990 / CIP 109136 / DN127) TaxID=521010 RepID=G0AP67_BORBD|nr:virulence associated lipoprotein [Borreliella bissettiae]AEL19493.1 putative lipoprotein, borrelia PFam60 protein [Borreliella bissettiae DN127]
MKYHIYICVFLLLNACNSDFNTNQKDIKYPFDKEKSKFNTEASSKQEGPNREELKPSIESDPKQEEDLNKKIKNTLLNNLRNLIEAANVHKEKYIKRMEEEPADQYGMGFEIRTWGKGQEDASANTERSIRFRRHTYTVLSTIDTKDLKELGNIIKLSGSSKLFSFFSDLGSVFDIVTAHLYSKKDNLDKLDISDLEKLKVAFEKILSTMKIISEILNQLLLDYQDDKNLIKTDVTKLKSYASTLVNQIQEKTEESEGLQKVIELIAL